MLWGGAAFGYDAKRALQEGGWGSPSQRGSANHPKLEIICRVLSNEKKRQFGETNR